MIFIYFTLNYFYIKLILINKWEIVVAIKINNKKYNLNLHLLFNMIISIDHKLMMLM